MKPSNPLLGGPAKRTGCRDTCWAVAFLLQLAGMLGVSFYYYSKNKAALNPDAAGGYFIDENAFTMFGVILATGMAVALFWLVMIRYNAGCIIKLTLFLSVAMWFVMAGLSAKAAMSGDGTSWIMPGMFALFGLLNILYIYCIRHRIAFATAILETCVAAINQTSATLCVSFFSMFVQVGWMFAWIMGVAFISYGNNGEEDSVSTALLAVLVLSFFWTAQVVCNVVHVTTAGAISTWFFLFPGSMPASPVWGSFKRATTTSFGSICYGSFIIATIQTIRFLVNSARNNENGFVRCCINCILQCIEDIMKYINTYAFVQVAVYGKTYCEAAKDTFRMLSERGWDMIINDDLTGMVLGMGMLVGGAVTAGVALLFSHYFESTRSDYWAIWTGLGFAMGFAITACAMVVVQSAVATIFVCFIEQPQALAETKPDEYNPLSTAWRERWGKTPEAQGA